MSDRKFILNSSELGRVTLNDDPIGWDSVKKIYTRNLKLLGVFRKRTAALKFVGDGLEYCVSLFDLKGTEAVMNVIIMQKKDYEDAWELEFEGIGKFNPFDLEWDDDLSPSLTIEFEDSGFHNKFLTRIGTAINIGSETTIEGLDIGPMPTKDIQVHQRTIQENNAFTMSANTHYYHGGTLPDPYIQSYRGQILPFEKISGETEFIVSPFDYMLDNPGFVCEFVTQPTACKITGRVKGTGNTENSQIGWYIRKYTDSSDLNIFTDILLFEITGIPTGVSEPIEWDFTIDENLSLNVGEAFTILCTFTDSDPITYNQIYEICDLNILLIQNFNEYVSKCHWRYEFMKRLTQIITDQDDCFKSDVFGRSELGYNINGTYYNNVLFNGKQLRGFNDFPVWTFDKAVQSVKSIWNVGCGIEKTGTRFRVVVEELPYFFKGTISVTLHNVRKVRRSINENFTFSEVRVGYEKAEYEQVNGLEEYNNKSTFATFIKSDTNVLDLISPERADGYGMEFARRKNILVAASEDTPYDQEVFTAMINEGEGGVLRTQKDENYDTVENILSPETAINLDITPQRNLIRNGDWIKGCTNKYPDEYLKFVSADKATDLSSVRTGSPGVVEQTSIQNNALKSSLWLNMNYLFEADITPGELNIIDKKPGDLIKFSPFDRAHTRKYYYGWIIEITAGGKDRTGSFTLLAANVNSDRLKIVDPDGIDNTDQGTPLPPSAEDFGFEYAFEKVFES